MVYVKKSSKKLVGAACVFLALLTVGSSSAFAYTFGAESIQKFGKECGCYSSNLRQTHAQVRNFVSQATSLGNKRDFWYTDRFAEATDLLDDEMTITVHSPLAQYHGHDDWYGDSVDMYVFSGHGGVNADGSKFYMPMCSLYSDQRVKENICEFSTEYARWGEKSGTYATKPGHLRWVALATCYGVDEHPNRAWGQVARTGLEYIVGYRGLSYDSTATLQVLAKWAKKIEYGHTFRSAWFSAIMNDRTDDVGAVVSFGRSRFEAIGRRDNQTLYSERRSAEDVTRWAAWAWKKAKTQ